MHAYSHIGKFWIYESQLLGQSIMLGLKGKAEIHQLLVWKRRLELDIDMHYKMKLRYLLA